MILTAAHCMMAYNLASSLIGHVYAHAGSIYRDLGTQRRRVNAKSCHPSFRVEDVGGWTTFANDLCILRVYLGLLYVIQRELEYKEKLVLDELRRILQESNT